MLENSETKKELIKYLSKIVDYKINLPKGALGKSDDVYVVTGRHNGDSLKVSFLQKGNPIDIIGGFAANEDLYGTNDEGGRLSDFKYHRLLQKMKEGLRYGYPHDHIFSQQNNTFKFQDGVLVPDPINPLETKVLDHLSDLKDSKVFRIAAEICLGNEEIAQELTNYLF